MRTRIRKAGCGAAILLLPSDRFAGLARSGEKTDLISARFHKTRWHAVPTTYSAHSSPVE